MAQRATETEFTLDTAAELAGWTSPRRDPRPEPLVPRLAPSAPELRRFLLPLRLPRRRRRVHARARLREATSPHRPEHEPHPRGGQGERRIRRRSSRPAAIINGQARRVDPDRADLVRRRAASSCSAPTTNGRDVAVRLLYGGRTSLIVGIGSSAICVFFAVVLALLAGVLRRLDRLPRSRASSTSSTRSRSSCSASRSARRSSINGFHHFGITIQSGSLWIPTLVISYVLVPYVGRPLRGQVLSLREKEFIEAAIAQGASPLRIMFIELLPNLASSVLVFFTLIIANNIVLEAALSFLGAGRAAADVLVGHADLRRAGPDRHAAVAVARARASRSSSPCCR